MYEEAGMKVCFGYIKQVWPSFVYPGAAHKASTAFSSRPELSSPHLLLAEHDEGECTADVSAAHMPRITHIFKHSKRRDWCQPARWSCHTQAASSV